MSALAQGEQRRPSAKTRTYRRVTPRFWLLVASVILAYTACIYALDGYRLWRLHGEIAAVNRAIDQTVAQNEALRQQIATRHSDAYVERVARQQLGMVKDGEIPFIVTDPGK